MSRIVHTVFLAILILLFTHCTESGSKEKTATSPPAPNLLLIITDDQGWGDLGSNGNDTLSTPNLDKLANESFSFDRFYVSPLCAPTRASVLTGRYHLRTGVHGVTGRREVMNSSELTLAEILKSSDYQTHYFGKWHNGAQYPHNPVGQGFDHFFGFCAGHWNNYFDTELEYKGQLRKTQGYITDVLTDSVIHMIANAGSVPFFSFLAYNTPHSPFQVPDQWFDKYKAMGLSDKQACIYGMIENIDYNIGRILHALEANHKAEETIVVFLSDNGPNSWRYNGNMKGIKAWVDEGGVRVPCFIRVPWLSENAKEISTTAAHIDLMPTLISLCNAGHPDGISIDGIDLSPLFTTLSNRKSKRFIFTDRCEGDGSNYSVRRGKFLLSVKNDSLLFDLEKDPRQLTDIADNHPKLFREFLDKANSWYADLTSNGQEIPAVECGHKPAPEVRIPAHETAFKGNVRFKYKHGWANDWLENIQNPGDQLIWDIDVIRSGNYQFSLKLSSAAPNKNASFQISTSGQKIVAKPGKAYTTEDVFSPDRVKRKEAYEKKWPEMEFGSLYLDKGPQRIVFSPLETLPEGIEIKELIIRSLYNY